MTIKIDECKLISGKEALIALANGKDVDACVTLRQNRGEWHWFNAKTLTVNEIEVMETNGDLYGGDILEIAFRLKPRTITINGIEVPAPFEPKSGEDFYYLDCTSDNYGGWAKTSWRNVESDSFKNNTVFGAWRTEEEIKQVVAALRQVFGGSHDN